MQKQRSNIVFQCINVCQVPRELLKTSAFGLGFQHLPRDLADVNAWKTMFDPYIVASLRIAHRADYNKMQKYML